MKLILIVLFLIMLCGGLIVWFFQDIEKMEDD